MVPGVSENSFNASVFFENDIISTRLAYNWRSEWIGVGAAQAVKNDNYQQMRCVNHLACHGKLRC